MKLRKKNALPLLDLESSSSGSEYEEGEDEDGSSCPYSSHGESSEWETDEEGAAAEQAHTVGLTPVRKSGNEAGAGAVYDTDAAAGPRAVDPVPPVLRPNPAAMSAVQYQPCRVRSASAGAGDRTGAGPHNVFQGYSGTAAMPVDCSGRVEQEQELSEPEAEAESEEEDGCKRRPVAPGFNPFSLLTSSDEDEEEDEPGDGEWGDDAESGAEDEEWQAEEDEEAGERGAAGGDAQEDEQEGEGAREECGAGCLEADAAGAEHVAAGSAGGEAWSGGEAATTRTAAAAAGTAVPAAAVEAGPSTAATALAEGAGDAVLAASQSVAALLGAAAAPVASAGSVGLCAPDVERRCAGEMQASSGDAVGAAARGGESASAPAAAGPVDAAATETLGASAAGDRLARLLQSDQVRAHTAIEAVTGAEVKAAAAASEEGASESDVDAAECWVCYGRGRPVGCGFGGDAAGAGAHSDGAAAGGDELVAPCGVCCGGVRYIHRHCFMRWLDSSWAVTCPNCRSLYDRSVLDTFTGSGSLRALWAAACPPSHDPRRPFPYNSMAHFCVGGTVEVAMAVGGFTAVQLLRRVKAMTDEWRLAGADGGLGLVRSDGSRLVLPSFEVTGLVLELGGGEEDEWGLYGGSLEGQDEEAQANAEDEDEMWDPVPPRRGRGGGPVGAYAGGDDASGADRRRPQSPPPGATRPYGGNGNSTSASSSNGFPSNWYAPPRSAPYAHAAAAELQWLQDIDLLAAALQQQGQQEEQGWRLAAQAAGGTMGLHGDLRVPWLSMLMPGEPAVSAVAADWQRADLHAIPMPDPVRMDGEFARSAAERVAQRAEQRRRREEAMRQQRVLTQRHAGQQTRQHATSGAQRFAGGGRRRQ